MDGRLALYRTWRPRRFADVVGQEHVTRALRRAVAQGRTAHAYLFCGPRGTGKTSVARILAQALLCRQPRDGEPCGGCDTCRLAQADRLLAIEEIDAASHRGIDDVRALRERVALSPGDGQARVDIVDEVHMLTPEAFNALLKTLEEPPPHVYFVLATTEPRKVPATIASRCQRFDFHRLGEAQIARRLREIADHLGQAVDDEALLAIAERAEGGLRDAIGLLDQCLVYTEGRLTADDVAAVVGTATRRELSSLAEAVRGGRADEAWRIVGLLYESGRDLAQVTHDLVGLWRRFWAEAPDDEARRRELGVIERLLALEGELRRGAPARLAVEAAVAEAALARATAGPKAKAACDPPPPPETELALAELRAAWREIVAGQDPPFRAILRECEPERLADGVLTLAFRREFHLEEARRRGYLARLAGLVKERVGLAVEVAARLASDEASTPGRPAQARGPEGGAGPRAADRGDPLARLAPEERETVMRVVERLGPPLWIEVEEADETAPGPAFEPPAEGRGARRKGARR
ncbi:MAG: DNA polymerase III subunit gamma/tau [Clostridia bacterium]|nr:DNA polymerase III subunit gamma/tau [Clostridia bacterium]